MRAGKKLVCFVIIMLPGLLLAQSRISGKITNGIQGLQGANVVVLKTDSGYVAEAVTDSIGNYTIDNLKYNKYQFLISLKGYIKKVVEVEINQDNTELSNIILEQETFEMKEVIVSSKRAAFKSEPGKITVDLNAASLGSDGSLLNALGKIPGIVILNDGTILLNGQAGANVMIDDKLTYLSGENLVNMLRSIPSSAVDKIEMVSQPSARYDASGTSGFINIRRKKRVDSGLNLVVSSNAETGRYIRENQSISLRLQQKKYSFYTDYSLYSGRDFMLIGSSRQYFNAETFNQDAVRLDMHADREFCSLSNYFKTGMEYEFSKKLTVGTYINGNWFGRSKKESAQSVFFPEDFTTDSSTLTNNIQKVNRSNIESGLNFSYKFNSKLKWENALNFLSFKQDEKLDQTSWSGNRDKSTSENALRGEMDGNIKILNLQSDVSYTISDRFTILSGIKSSVVNIDNNALYYSRQLDSWQRDEKLSSGFLYKESILAGYLQTSQKWMSSLSTEVGLRFEYTDNESGFMLGSNDAAITRSYGQLFPSLKVNYSFTEGNIISLQYGRRIVRPNYRDLNPFTEVNDRYLHERGNTKLNPELVNNLEVTWLIKSKYVFSLFYTTRKNPIAKSYLTEQGSEITIVMPLNLKESYVLGFRANINTIRPTEYWTVQFNSSLTFKQFHWLEAEKLYANNLLTPTVQISNQFTLPYQWAFEATGFFNGKMVEGQAEIGSFGSLSLGARKSFFEKKISLYLYANDIFLTNRQQINLRNAVIAGSYRERRDSRMIGFTLTWKFNSGDLSKTIRKAGDIEESKRINL